MAIFLKTFETLIQFIMTRFFVIDGIPLPVSFGQFYIFTTVCAILWWFLWRVLGIQLRSDIGDIHDEIFADNSKELDIDENLAFGDFGDNLPVYGDDVNTPWHGSDDYS